MLVSIAIVTVILSYLWPPELGRWQRPRVAMLVTIVTALLCCVVRLPVRVVPADGLEWQEPRSMF